MGPILLEQLLLGPTNPVAVKQIQDFVQSLPTPPYPAEALAFPGSHHMAPDLLFYPVANEPEALAGMPDRKVAHPSAQYRVDQLHNSALPYVSNALFVCVRFFQPQKVRKAREFPYSHSMMAPDDGAPARRRC